MDADIVIILKRILLLHGIEICKSRRRLEGILRDLIPNHAREINLLMAIVDYGMIDLIASHHVQLPRHTVEKFTEQIHDHYGLVKEYAKWAVIIWGQALGKNVPQNSIEKKRENVNIVPKNSIEKKEENVSIVPKNHPVLIWRTHHMSTYTHMYKL